MRIDIRMEVGEVSQITEVVAQTPLLQTQATSLSQVVEGRTVQEMPPNGRNVLNLIALVPGVVPQGQAMGSTAGVNIFAWGNYQIGGGLANQSASFLDGGPLNVNYANLTALVPSQDAVSEFRVQTNNLSPEFGRFTGGVVNLSTKSGTNVFHGSAYEFPRNRPLNANDFFNNSTNTPRPAFTQNQYGVSVGGRVIKDKTFFFASCEGFRLRHGLPYVMTVPTVAMRDGDFTQLRNSAGRSIPVYDPLTTCGVLGNPPCGSDQTIRRTPFPLNAIPADRKRSAALNFLQKLFPLPNTAGNLVSMRAQCARTIKGSFAPALFAEPEVAGGEDAGDRSEILGWNVQDGSPRCGLAPQRKSALRSFRCRVAAGACETHSAVNIRREFEKCKPRRTVVLTKLGHSPARGRSQVRRGEMGLTRTIHPVLRGSARRTGPSGSIWLCWG